MTRKKYEVDTYNVNLMETEESLDTHIILNNQSHKIEKETDSDDDTLTLIRHKVSQQEKAENLFFSLRDHVHSTSLPLFDNATLDSWFLFLEQHTSLRFEY
jgi:hypothetical protein